jgi:peptidoglycan/xylan/chitin deacetylase (PgdA/CDA1 family)
MHVRELAECIAEGIIPPRSVAITFDDGYRDNLEYGHPILTQFETPATIFVTANHVGAKEEFWWDALDRIFLQAGELPRTLELSLGDEMRHWDLGSYTHFSAAEAERCHDWEPHKPAPTVRHAMYAAIWKDLFKATREERARLTRYLIDWAGQPRMARSTHRTVDESELRKLAADKLIEIGAHTLTHPSLARLSLSEQLEELQHSKARLEMILRQPITGSSYPHGGLTQDTPRLAREAGYLYSCGSNPGVVRAAANPFKIPRMVVGGWTATEFKNFLSSWLPV